MINVTDPLWKHKEHMEFGVSQGWWTHWDEIGPFKTLKFQLSEFKNTDTMAHVMVKANQFTSVSEGKRNGWDKPITVGEHILKKRRVIITIC